MFLGEQQFGKQNASLAESVFQHILVTVLHVSSSVDAIFI